MMGIGGRDYGDKSSAAGRGEAGLNLGESVGREKGAARNGHLEGAGQDQQGEGRSQVR